MTSTISRRQIISRSRDTGLNRQQQQQKQQPMNRFAPYEDYEEMWFSHEHLFKVCCVCMYYIVLWLLCFMARTTRIVIIFNSFKKKKKFFFLFIFTNYNRDDINENSTEKKTLSCMWTVWEIWHSCFFFVSFSSSLASIQHNWIIVPIETIHWIKWICGHCILRSVLL